MKPPPTRRETRPQQLEQDRSITGAGTAPGMDDVAKVASLARR
jgi:hypothetical protein